MPSIREGGVGPQVVADDILLPKEFPQIPDRIPGPIPRSHPDVAGGTRLFLAADPDDAG